jgi:hypothetical protein
MRLGWVVIVAGLSVGTSSVAVAQTPGGAFERLAPGDQRIARSLYEAQRRDLPSGTRRFTIEEIAAKKTESGWSAVFKEMKAQHLVKQKNLTEVLR